MVEFLASAAEGMVVTAAAFVLTFLGLKWAVPAIQRALLDPRWFPLKRDLYLNREYAKPEKDDRQKVAPAA